MIDAVVMLPCWHRSEKMRGGHAVKRHRYKAAVGRITTQHVREFNHVSFYTVMNCNCVP